MRDALMVLALCLTGGVAHGQTANDGVANDAERVLSVEWTGPCDQVDRPFFALDFYASGAVRYVGGEQMREIGERSMAIGERAVRRLVARAKRIARGSENEIGDSPPQLPYDHCVRITLHDGGEAARVSLSSRRPEVLDFALTIDERARFALKICPPRDGDATPFSGANYCTAPSVILHLRSDGSCLGLHIVDVYEDGTVHYYASEVVERDGRRTRVYFGDSYDHVSSGVVDELFAFVQSLQAFRVSEHSTQLRYGTHEELLSLRDRVDAATTFEWAEIGAASECSAMVDSYALANR